MAEITTEPTHDAHAVSDSVHFLGRDFSIPGGIYTFIFIDLAIFTILEVLLAETLADGSLRIFVLLGIAVVKAVLVMWFYMHLKDDNRIFLYIMILAFVITLMSVLFLMVVPENGGGYTLLTPQ